MDLNCFGFGISHRGTQRTHRENEENIKEKTNNFHCSFELDFLRSLCVLCAPLWLISFEKLGKHSAHAHIMDNVSELSAQARNLDLLGKMDFTDADAADDLLEAREAYTFDGEWMRVYSAVQDAEVEGELQTKNVGIDDLREWAYKRAHGISGNAEIAGYVADDFELIARALQADYNDEWLGALWQEYRAGHFPCGDLS